MRTPVALGGWGFSTESQRFNACLWLRCKSLSHDECPNDGQRRAALGAASAHPNGALVARHPAPRVGDPKVTAEGQPHPRSPRPSHLRDPARQRQLLCIAHL